MHALIALVLLGGIVAGLVAAIVHGLFGAGAEKELEALKADVLAEITKIEKSASADEKAVIAKIKTALAKL